jgi:beta-galactosidase
MLIPKGFLLGFSESGFQFEMGLPGSEDPNSDWWVWVHDHENMLSGVVSGDLPENGPGYWNLYKVDHDLAFKLGMNCARIGVEWSRVFPKPTKDIRVDVDRDEDGNIVWIDVNDVVLEKLDSVANADSVNHYKSILEDWKSRGGTIVLNLNHFTLPLWIHDPIALRSNGSSKAPSGWLSEETVVEFAKYATYIAWKLDDLVDLYSTLNEPNVVYTAGYIMVKTGFPPGLLSIKAATRAAKHLVEAHVRAYENIKRITRKPVGIIVSLAAIEPIRQEYEDVAGLAKTLYNYSILDSITLGSSMITGSREDLRDKVDWIGVNYYSRLLVKPSKTPGFFDIVKGAGLYCNSKDVSITGRPCSDMGWEVYPEGLSKVLEEVWSKYRKPLIVTENGIADSRDVYRPKFLISHISHTVQALKEGVDVKGYLHWALTDNLEWAQGYSMRFGLVKVDYETKRRLLRPSALLFKEIAESQDIPDDMDLY